MIFGVTGKDRPRGPRRKNVIPQELLPVYADVAAKAQQLQDQGLTLAEIAQELNRLGYRTRTGKRWQFNTQISKLLRSFGGQLSELRRIGPSP